MQRRILHRFAAVAAAVVLISALVPAFAAEMTSRMRTVSGVFAQNGYLVEPVSDASVQSDPRDRVTPQAYEIIRPDINAPLTIGRLFTSCSCIQLEAQKRTFGPGERAIIVLRNIRATPADGQMYSFFVQIREPMEMTLRFDTFVQSGVGIGTPSAVISDITTPAPSAVAGTQPAGNPVPGLNDQLAAAFAAVGTADLLGGTADEAAAGAADETAAEPAGEAAPLEPEAQEAALVPQETIEEAAKEAVEAAVEEELAEEAAEEVAAALTEDQTLQIQQLALIRAEEQARQLADRVRQLQEAQNAAMSAAPAPDFAGRPVQAISLITIGVRDMAASIRFYEAIGWQRAARGKYDQTAFFQLNGQVLALYPVADLLLEQNMADARPSPGGVTLALHVGEKEDVNSVYSRFVDAGGKPLRAPAEMASGAVSGYVADPDGNPWEISWVPQFRIDPNGGLWLP